MDVAEASGLYGKMPGFADFVRRRVSLGVIEPWDRWLQGAVAASRRNLGEGWLEIYLTSPIWRWVLAAGVCGPDPLIGVLMPSVDAVNRHYPLVILKPVSDSVGPFALATAAGAWFEAAEALGLDCLAGSMATDTLDERLAALPPVEGSLLTDGDRGARAEMDKGFVWSGPRVACDDLASELWPHLLDTVAAGTSVRPTLWLTAGSDHVAPSVAVFEGLPPADVYTALLAGPGGRTGVAGGAAMASRNEAQG